VDSNHHPIIDQRMDKRERRKEEEYGIRKVEKNLE